MHTIRDHAVVFHDRTRVYDSRASNDHGRVDYSAGHYQRPLAQAHRSADRGPRMHQCGQEQTCKLAGAIVTRTITPNGQCYRVDAPWVLPVPMEVAQEIDLMVRQACSAWLHLSTVKRSVSVDEANNVIARLPYEVSDNFSVTSAAPHEEATTLRGIHETSPWSRCPAG
jgi:hypothetical protein